MSTQPKPGPLSANCMRILSDNDMSAKAVGAVGASMVALYTGDGDLLLHVHEGIEAIDLRTMLTMHRERFSAGERAGREGAFAALRAFIGVDAAIAKATGSES
jgi:hypothetical protein